MRNACAGDYLSQLQRIPAGKRPDAASCMRAVGYKLSKGCINALVAAGEVSKAEIARRSASFAADLRAKRLEGRGPRGRAAFLLWREPTPRKINQT